MRCNKKTLLTLAGCSLWLAWLGWIDRATGYELGLFAFYTAPVGVVAWTVGQEAGIAAALVASIVWFMADRYGGGHYSSQFYAYWNAGMNFSSFIINAVSFARMKTALERRRELERALKAAQDEVQRLSSGSAVSASSPHCQKEIPDSPGSAASPSGGP